MERCLPLEQSLVKLVLAGEEVAGTGATTEPLMPSFPKRKLIQ